MSEKIYWHVELMKLLGYNIVEEQDAVKILNDFLNNKIAKAKQDFAQELIKNKVLNKNVYEIYLQSKKLKAKREK